MIRSWQRSVAHRSRWLLIGKENEDGIMYFWKEYRSHRGQGRVTFLSDSAPRVRSPSAKPSGPITAQLAPHALTTLLPPPVADRWDFLEARLKQRWSGIILSNASDLPESVIRNVARLGGVPVMDLPDCYERWWGRIPVSHVRGDWLALSFLLRGCRPYGPVGPTPGLCRSSIWTARQS